MWLVIAGWSASALTRTREVHIGCTRPWRKLSVLCHISLTGLPIAFEIAAASNADRRLHRRPDLGAPGLDVGNRAVGLQRVAGTEVEREALIERLPHSRPTS
jgi:hypothetical protein